MEIILAGVNRNRVAAAHCKRSERSAGNDESSSVRSAFRADASARSASRPDARSDSISATTCTSSRAHAIAPSTSDTSCDPAGLPGLRTRLAASEIRSTAAASSLSLYPSSPGT
eukprot:scaffold46781_cov258-Isochrysis_galbana.AAC.3